MKYSSFSDIIDRAEGSNMQRYFIKKKDFSLEDTDIRHIKKVMRMNINDLIEVVYNNNTRSACC